MFNNEFFEWHRSQILLDYPDAFENISEELKEDIIKIKFFLYNKIEILHGLQKLEIALNKKLISKNINCNQFLASNDTKNHKILSDTLKKDWLPYTSFSSHIPKINEVLFTSAFFNHLRNKMLFKDVGAPIKHGEWTHFIQWYLIKNNIKLTNALFHSPEHIYEILGLQPHKETDFQDNTLWDVICDVLDLPDNLLYENFDFSSPEYVMDFILDSKDSFPILFTCINKRMLKRKNEKMVTPLTMQ